MRQPLTTGVVCATLTPMDDAGAPLLPELAIHCRRLFDDGCSAIVLLGTTGEANSFAVAERQAILDGVVAAGVPPSQLIVGIGCCAVADTVALARRALAAGCTRLLVLPPFYYKGVGDTGVAASYRKVIEAIGDPRMRLYLYRIPKMSGVDISFAVIEELLGRYPGVVAGIKDSSGDWTSMEALCMQFGDAMDVLVGDERFLGAALDAGASGCVTATANATARLVCAAYARRGETDGPSLHERMCAARGAFERFPLIAALKEHAARVYADVRWRNIRPPLELLAAEQRAAFLAATSTL